MRDRADDRLFDGLQPTSAARARRRPWTPIGLGVAGARRVGYWGAVALPLALLAQVVLLGLGPAREESLRLRRAEQALTRRLDAAVEQQAEYELHLRAYRDPIYLERERRLMAALEDGAR